MSADPTGAPAAPHSHNFLGSSHDTNARRTLWVVALTAVMMVAEITAGVMFGSMALLADGIHMATHAGALGIAALAYRFATRHADDPRYSFGTGKVGDLAGFGSAMVLGAVSIGIAVESFTRLIEPQEVDFGPATLVAVIGLAVNLVSALLLGGEHHHHHGHHHDHRDHHAGHEHEPHITSPGHDNNLRAAYLHVLADALTSLLAIVALLAGRFLDWVWLDPMMGIVGALVIARWSWSLVTETADVLLDASSDKILAQVRRRLEPLGVETLDLHVWRVGPQAHAAIVSYSGAVDAAMVRRGLAGISGIEHLTIERH